MKGRKENTMLSDTVSTSEVEVPIACDPTPITPDQRERWMEVGTQVYKAIREIQDLPDGYAFRLPNDPEMLLLVAEDLNFERLCCPFVRYTLEIEPNKGPFWLRMTGREGVKEFVRMEFEASDVIDENVAKAAGFSVSNRINLDSVKTTLQTINVVNERFAKEAGSS
jgi:hypothetical protein